jgi:hypothetical protein
MTSIEPLSRASYSILSGATEIWDGSLSMNFAPDEEIYGQDESADLIYQLVKGSVRTSHILPDGRRQIADFYYEGDIFGVEPGSEHRFSAEALTTCEVLVVKRPGSVAFAPGEVPATSLGRDGHGAGPDAGAHAAVGPRHRMRASGPLPPRYGRSVPGRTRDLADEPSGHGRLSGPDYRDRLENARPPSS